MTSPKKQPRGSAKSATRTFAGAGGGLLVAIDEKYGLTDEVKVVD